MKPFQINRAQGSIFYVFTIFSKSLSKMFAVHWLIQDLGISLLLSRFSLALHT